MPEDSLPQRVLPWALRNPVAGTALQIGTALKVRGAQLSKWQATEVAVPVGPQGQPSYRLLSFSRSVHKPRICRNGSREDFRVLLSPARASLGAVCLGRTSERGNPEESARQVLDMVIAQGQRPQPPVIDSVAGEHALRYTIAMGGSLTEWKFAHEGWLFAVGIVNCQDNENEMVAKARAVLDSWRWTGESG